MHTGSLQNSSSFKSLNQDLNHTELLSEHLVNRFDFFATTVLDYMNEKDPKKRFGKINAARLKETENLRQENGKLHLKVIDQQKQIEKLKEEINKFKGLKSSHTQFPQNDHKNLHEAEESSDSTLSKGQKSTSNPAQILPEEQRKSLQQIEEIEKHMREQRADEQKQLESLINYFRELCERLNRIEAISRITENDHENLQTNTVQVSKRKYDLLIDFYCRGSAQNKTESSQASQVGEFRAQQSRAPNHETEEFTADELQKIFDSLAQKNGKFNEWKTFLENIQGENDKKLSKIKEIAESQISKEDQQRLQEAKKAIRLNQSFEESATLDTTQSIVNVLEKEMEEKLFEKIKVLLKQLAFSQDEFNLFLSFDEKRKCGRLYNVEEFLNKFKTKTDMHQISQAFSVYLIKTLNFMLVNAMQLISGSNPENSDWFKQKLLKKSDQFRIHLLKVLEEQISTYIEEKKKKKNCENGGKESKNDKTLTGFLDEHFDKQKLLEKHLVLLVCQYKEILKSSIFNYNSEIKISW